MTILQAVVLAVIQGLTEFLPVSSSGHLVLVSQLSDLSDQGVAFDAAVHLGTLLAIVIYLRADLIEICSSLMQGKKDAHSRLGINIIIASLPVLIIGYLLADWIDANTRNIPVIAVTTIVFGLLLGIADRAGRSHRKLPDIRLPQAVVIGLAQVLALIPGTSRSGVTMTAGLALGLGRVAAARFAFLLSVPVLAAAGGYSLLQLVTSDHQAYGSMSLLAVAMLVSAVIAFATISLFIRLVESIGMWLFVYYRLLLGVVLLLVWL